MSPYVIEVYVSDSGYSIAVEPMEAEEGTEPKGTPVKDAKGVLEAVMQALQNGKADENASAEGEFNSGFSDPNARFA